MRVKIDFKDAPNCPVCYPHTTSAAMKTLSTMLILLLFLHLQCGGSCLSESLGANPATNTEPPCHDQTPTNDPQPSHHPDATCSQGPLIEAKLSIGKVIFQSDAALPDTIRSSHPTNFQIRRHIPPHLQ